MLCENITETELKKVYVDGFLLIPLGEYFHKAKGILEISGFTALQETNTRVRALDFEYYAIVLTLVIKALLNKLTKEAVSAQERRFYKRIFFIKSNEI